MRKQLVLVALLTTAGCAETSVRSTASGPPTASVDCDAAMARGIQRLTAALREAAPDPQTLEDGIRGFDKIQGALVRRCVVDSWPPEVAQCFATLERRADLQACQSKLSAEPASRLATELAALSSSKEDRCAERVLAARRPHARSQDSVREAMEMMKDYKVALCDCRDHDLACGQAATDAYQRAMADWATRQAGTRIDFARPDPELEALTTEVADCAKRVLTPAPAAGSTTRPSPP